MPIIYRWSFFPFFGVCYSLRWSLSVFIFPFHVRRTTAVLPSQGQVGHPPLPTVFFCFKLHTPYWILARNKDQDRWFSWELSLLLLFFLYCCYVLLILFLLTILEVIVKLAKRIVTSISYLYIISCSNGIIDVQSECCNYGRLENLSNQDASFYRGGIRDLES